MAAVLAALPPPDLSGQGPDRAVVAGSFARPDAAAAFWRARGFAVYACAWAGGDGVASADVRDWVAGADRVVFHVAGPPACTSPRG